MTNHQQTHIAFTCGGTGGHVYPAIALAQYFESCSITFLMSTDRNDREIIQAYGYQGVEIPSSRANPLTVLRGLMRSWIYLKRLRPHVLVATGGYHTAPVILAAKLLSIPIVLLEQNVLPGRVNRTLSRLATQTCVSFSESLHYLPNAQVTGNPVRLQYLHEPQLLPVLKRLSDHPTILVMGGSQGAKGINDFIMRYRDDILSRSYNLIHLTGASFFKAHFEGKQPTFRQPKTNAVALVLPYCDDMKALYEQADIVISRAGATTIAELLSFQKKAILIPYPYAKDNHQLYNARAFESASTGMVIDENTLSQDVLWTAISTLDRFKNIPSSQPKEPLKSAVENVGDIVKRYM